MSFRFFAYPCFCLLLLCATFTARAKKTINWQPFPTDSLTGSISFNSVRILDQREDKSNLGQSVAGLSKRPFTTTDSLPLTLSNMIGLMSLDVTERKDQELLIIVRNIELRDLTRELPMISTIYLRIDWYLGHGDSYSLVKQTDSLYEFPAQRNATQIVMSVADMLLTESVKEVAAAAPDANHFLPLAGLLATEAKARESHAVYNAAPQKGIYYAPDQFLSNTPRAGDFIHKHYGPDLYLDEFFLKDERGKKGRNLADTPSCYAIYNGEKWYRPYTQTDFKEMKRVGNDFYYYAIQKGIHLEDYSAVAGVGAPYGAVGALISTAVAGAFQDRQKRKPIPMADALYRMRLDPVTGAGKRVERLR